MTRTSLPLAIGFVLIALSLTYAADDTLYQIKVDSEKLGFKTQVSRKASSQMNLTQMAKGTTKVNEIKTSTDEVFVEEIVERPNPEKPATKITRSYKKARFKVNELAKARSYEGKSLLIERSGERFRFTIDGQDLPRDEAVEFDRRFNRDRPHTLEIMLPGKAVKQDDPWNVPLESVAKMLAEQLEINPANSTATGKLLKVHERDGHQFGVLQIEMNLAVNKVKLGTNWLPASDKGKAVVKIDADVCIDGTAPDGTLKSVTDIQLTVDVPAGPVKVKIQSNEEVTGQSVKAQ